MLNNKGDTDDLMTGTRMRYSKDWSYYKLSKMESKIFKSTFFIKMHVAVWRKGQGVMPQNNKKMHFFNSIIVK